MARLPLARFQTDKRLASIGAWGSSNARLVAVIAAVTVALSGTAGAEPTKDLTIGGRAIAQRNCGACHAIASEPSPLADAPPFNQLWRRYPPGGLDLVLREGMLRPSRVPEEGSELVHPRMPMADLGDDEVLALKAYLRSLDPRHGRSGRR